jgi:hypothetical protein
MFQLEHFILQKNYWRKLLILRESFWTEQWNQWVRLWKERLLSRTLNVY